MNTTSEAHSDAPPPQCQSNKQWRASRNWISPCSSVNSPCKKDGRTNLLPRPEQFYRQFLALKLVYPKRTISPTVTIDEFWHAHILDTHAYMADCKALFGHYLHHYPYSGMKDMFELMLSQVVHAEMRELFLQHFGVDPLCAAPASHRHLTNQRIRGNERGAGQSATGPPPVR